MKQEDKDLLLKDLCSRLPYSVKVDIPDLFLSTKNNIEVLNEIFCGDDGEFRCNDSGMLIEYVKPYLFPLSSMTEEQEKEFNDLYYRYHESAFIFNERFSYDKWNLKDIGFYPYYLQDWFNKNNFDYRGLIPMELAIDATGKNVY